MAKENKKKFKKQLDVLRDFPDNELVRKLRKQIKTKIDRLETPKVETSINPNLSRSTKLKKYHQYIRLIRNNFPNLSYAEIRKQFAKRCRQQDVSIPDAVWQNPFP